MVEPGVEFVACLWAIWLKGLVAVPMIWITICNSSMKSKHDLLRYFEVLFLTYRTKMSRMYFSLRLHPLHCLQPPGHELEVMVIIFVVSDR